MQFRVLGPLAVEQDARPLHLGGRKQRALLALLLLHANEVVARDVLIDELWGAEPPRSALHSLEVYVSRLRKAVAERLRTRPAGYVLQLEPAELDAQCFEDLLAEGRAALRAGEANAAADLLREALALWRGRPFEDLAYEPFVQVEATRLEELRLACVEERVEADLARGEHAGLVAELEALAARHPLRERLCEQLMLALYRSGRQVEALRVYRETRRRLLEVGVEPSHALRRLEQAILQQDAVLEAPHDAAARPRAPEPPPTELVGRAADITAASDLLGRREVRLLTLTGPGGVGKTRLALEVARAREGDFDLGVVFVSLAAVGNPDLVATAIAQAVGITELHRRPLLEQLVEHVGTGKLLLVLDNFEHVLDAAPFVAALVAATDRVKVLVTSRAALRASGEHELEVRPLPEEDAVRLFNLRAQAVLADFAATDAVPVICRRLDRLPLAIELSAARVRVLTLPALLDRLDRRLGLLSAGGRDTPERHQTLRATIDWSYQLLDDDEQGLFGRLAVFAGGCTLEDAEAVAGADLDLVASLIEKSLLRHEAGRITMLEMLHEYALEQLDREPDAAVVRLRHANHFLAVAEQANEELRIGILRWVGRLQTDLDNLRAALAWFRESGNAHSELRLAAALCEFWLAREYYDEGLRALESALSAEVESPLRARALEAAARLALHLDDLERAQRYASRCLRLARELGETGAAAESLITLAVAASSEGDVAQTRALLSESVDIARRGDNVGPLSSALDFLAELELEGGDADAARELFEEALVLREAIGSTGWVAWSHSNLGLVAHARGELDEALDWYRRALACAQELGVTQLATECLIGIAAVAAKRSDIIRAARLLAASEGISGITGHGGWLAEGALKEEALAEVQASLDEESLASLWEEGRAMTLAEAVAAAN
ncbi:MAG: BTAD domain-containing putative transcriptional regulator [Candidatus Doudnabacteria bacterium]